MNKPKPRGESSQDLRRTREQQEATADTNTRNTSVMLPSKVHSPNLAVRERRRGMRTTAASQNKGSRERTVNGKESQERTGGSRIQAKSSVDGTQSKNTTQNQKAPKKKKGKDAPKLLQGEDLLGEKFLVSGLIGAGGYGQVYKALDKSTEKYVAVKAEPKTAGPHLIYEQRVLTMLAGTKHYPELLGSGTHNDATYIVMELLGSNLSDLRKSFPNNRLDLSSTMRIIDQMIDALETLHNKEHLHRDIKPANICIGASDGRMMYLVDYGFVRRYREGDKLLIRERASMCGTLKYVSLNVHARKDQMPHDDMHSLYYTAVELCEGELPWKRLSREREVRESKKTFNRHSMFECPGDFDEFAAHLWDSQSKNETQPNYTRLREITRAHIPANAVKMCWEERVPTPTTRTPNGTESPDPNNNKDKKPTADTPKKCQKSR